MKSRALWIGLIAAAIIASITGDVAAQDDKKDAPGASTPQACAACHASDARFGRIHGMWQTSRHSKTLSVVAKSNQASADCYSCHSEEGFQAKLAGRKVDPAQKDSLNPVTCVTCHKIPHDGKNPHQLALDPESLCTSCHTQRAVLEGKGAKGIDETRSFHSAVECFSCHMTEANHLMKVIRPDDPSVSEKRNDTCTACHRDNNRKARITQLQDWQKSYKQEMDSLQAEVNTLTASLKENPNFLKDDMKAKLSDIRANLSLLTRDRSMGAHNFDFASEIFSRASKALREIKEKAK
jgi:predicted CXXCH cytochrome family protein